jgi:hypothetical protein
LHGFFTRFCFDQVSVDEFERYWDEVSAASGTADQVSSLFKDFLGT